MYPGIEIIRPVALSGETNIASDRTHCCASVSDVDTVITVESTAAGAVEGNGSGIDPRAG